MKARIQEIRLINFRAIANARLRLQDLTFLVGRNGAGKSSILDAVEFLREAVTDSLPNALDRRGGFLGVWSKTATDRDMQGIAIVWEMELDGQPVRALYGFQQSVYGGIREVMRTEPDLGYGYERLEKLFSSKVNLQPGIPDGRLLLPLIAGGPLWLPAFDIISGMRTYQFSPEAIAESDEIGPKTALAKNGRNAGDVLHELQNRQTGEWALFNQVLGEVTDGMSQIEALLQMRRRVIHASRAQGESCTKFTSLQLSSGTLRSIGILLSLLQRPKPSLVMVDEIEDSIHPHAIGALLEVAESTTSEFPVVVTTHSPEVLATPQVTPERVRIVQWKNGTSHVHRLSEGSVESVNSMNSVGDLLRFNSLWPSKDQETWQGDMLDFGE